MIGIVTAKGQSKDTVKNSSVDTSVYVLVDQPPEYPGGIIEFFRYIAKSTRYPAYARLHHLTGKVIAQFIIEKDGNISGIKIIRGVFPSLDQEAVRVLSTSPKWQPGIQNGNW